MANKNLFTQIELTKPGKNVFDLTHDVKLTMQMGKLVPICALETVPGDKFNISAESLIRMAPMVAPVMHRIDATIHYFFVPNRILWDGWEKWIVDPALTAQHPFITSDDPVADEELIDYFGIGNFSSLPGSIKINALPFAAYQKVYQDYYRDQNLIPENTNSWKLVAGDNSANIDDITATRYRAWEHDYFTSALPWAQKGDAVGLPLGDVQLKPGATAEAKVVWAATQTPASGDIQSESGAFSVETVTPGTFDPAQLDPNGTLQVEPTTINDLRRAFKLQEWLERNARAGTRYIENILAHFGVRSSDSRLQRPEYITGNKTPIVISEVLNTTGEAAGLPQGNMAGHGLAVVNGNSKSYYCEEHGWIIGIMSILPKPAYQDGIEKKFLKVNDPFEYFWPSFAHIGEQEVLQIEVYQQSLTPGATFGYVPRYAEYKYAPSRVAADFRTTLDYWHLGRQFASDPALNQEFIECKPDDRIFAVTDPTEDKFYVHVLNKIKAVRPMPYFGSPKM